MTRAEIILSKINTVLANQGRWGDNNLLSIIDTAQKLIAQRTEVLKKTSLVPLTPGQVSYNLGPTVHKIYRVLYKGKVLPIRTREYLNVAKGLDWETHTGEEIECVVTNLLDIPGLRIYPAISNIEVGGIQGVVVDADDIVMTSVYGVVTDISLIPDAETVLLVYHSYLPPSITKVTDELTLSARYDEAIVRYSTAMALRQNEDTQSRSMANEELQLFQLELQQIYKDAALESTADASSFSLTYTGAFQV